MVSYDTPLDVLEELKNRLRSYTTENSREWAGFDFNIDKMKFQNAIWLIIAIQRERLLLFISSHGVDTFLFRSPELAGLGRPLGSSHSLHASSQGHNGGARRQVQHARSTNPHAQ